MWKYVLIVTAGIFGTLVGIEIFAHNAPWMMLSHWNDEIGMLLFSMPAILTSIINAEWINRYMRMPDQKTGFWAIFRHELISGAVNTILAMVLFMPLSSALTGRIEKVGIFFMCASGFFILGPMLQAMTSKVLSIQILPIAPLPVNAFARIAVGGTFVTVIWLGFGYHVGFRPLKVIGHGWLLARSWVQREPDTEIRHYGMGMDSYVRADFWIHGHHCREDYTLGNLQEVVVSGDQLTTGVSKTRCPEQLAKLGILPIMNPAIENGVRVIGQIKFPDSRTRICELGIKTQGNSYEGIVSWNWNKIGNNFDETFLTLPLKNSYQFEIHCDRSNNYKNHYKSKMFVIEGNEAYFKPINLGVVNMPD
jgi:hypothetical protein